MQRFGLTAGILALAQGTALAATATFTKLPVDALAVQFMSSLTNVWIPSALFCSMITSS
jgi:hypothetical protein